MHFRSRGESHGKEVGLVSRIDKVHTQAWRRDVHGRVGKEGKVRCVVTVGMAKQHVMSRVLQTKRP